MKNLFLHLVLCFAFCQSALAIDASIEVFGNTVCNGSSVPTSLFEIKFKKGQVYDVFRSPAFPTKGQGEVITAHSLPYKSNDQIMIDEEWKDDYYMGLVNRCKVGELDRTDPIQKRVYDKIHSRSEIINAGVVIDDICVVATVLFDKNGKIVEYIGAYGILWGLSQYGFLFVDYTSSRVDYGTFYFIDKKVHIGSVLTYTPDYTIVSSLDDIINFFGPVTEGYSTCTGKAKVVLPDDSTNYEFKWNDPLVQTTCTATKLCPREYSVLVTDKRTGEQDIFTTLVEMQKEYLEETITEGETYDFYGTPLTTSGTYNASYISEEGCEIGVQLTLTVNPVVVEPEPEPEPAPEPETPVEPEEPVEPEKPVEPEVPVEPEEPEMPVEPSPEPEEKPEDTEQGDEEIKPALMFTPNGDGVHDLWVVENINEHFDVFIYNRFSKLLASYRGDFAGWDGIYNGKEQPTDDYWYVIIDRLKNKQYSGHFTLKR